MSFQLERYKETPPTKLNYDEAVTILRLGKNSDSQDRKIQWQPPWSQLRALE